LLLSSFENDEESIYVRMFPTKSFNEGKLKYGNMRLEYLTEKPALIICGFVLTIRPICFNTVVIETRPCTVAISTASYLCIGREWLFIFWVIFIL